MPSASTISAGGSSAAGAPPSGAAPSAPPSVSAGAASASPMCVAGVSLSARAPGAVPAVARLNRPYRGYAVPTRVSDPDPSLGEEMRYYETHIMTFFGPYGGDLMVNLGLRIARGVHARRR